MTPQQLAQVVAGAAQHGMVHIPQFAQIYFSLVLDDARLAMPIFWPMSRREAGALGDGLRLELFPLAWGCVGGVRICLHIEDVQYHICDYCGYLPLLSWARELTT